MVVAGKMQNVFNELLTANTLFTGLQNGSVGLFILSTSCLVLVSWYIVECVNLRDTCKNEMVDVIL